LLSHSKILKIIIAVFWVMAIFLYLYPAFFSYLALISYNTRGKDTFLKYMGIAYKSGRINPTSSATYSYILLKEGNIEAASEVLDYAELTALDRKSWRKGEIKYKHVHSYRALILWKQDRLDDATDLLMHLLKENYKTSTLYANLGWFLIKQDKLNLALEINLEAIEYDRTNAILDNLGLIYLKMGDLKKSREFYDELIENNPEFPDAWYNNGLLLELEGKKEDAQKMFQKALKCKFTFLGTITKEQVEQALK
jgi:tetratricopeptide (TPR) repeat protein